MSRAYCRDDRPFPVGARPLRTLQEMARHDFGIEASAAPAQIERLRRGGYAVINDGRATITDAGRALLAGTLRGLERP